jgi:hypothetical protein
MKIEQIRNRKFKIEGDYVPSVEWENFISESYYSEGFESFSRDCFVKFISPGLEFEVYFEIFVRGNVLEEKGDQLNPPETYVDITSEEIIINGVFVNGDQVEVDGEVNEFLSNFIKKNI